MQKIFGVAGAAILIAATATGAVFLYGQKQATPVAPEPPPNTAKVEKGKLSTVVTLFGTLTYRARADGLPYTVFNHARGAYTQLPRVGDKINCGDVLYQVNDQPVLLLCGTIPAYRNLHLGDAGNDVRQLNQNLNTLGYDDAAGVDIAPKDNTFTAQTEQAIKALQHDKGIAETGRLNLDDVVFLPEAVRVAQVNVEPGAFAQPDAPVLNATSITLEVQVALQASQQGAVKQGDLAQINLPDNRSVKGKVDRIGSVTQVPAGKNDTAGAVIIPAYISLDDSSKAVGLDHAPVRLEITTDGVENALSVPVTALVGKSGGGFAVEIVRVDGRRELVAVKPGLFAANGRVEVEGALREGDQVVVPTL